MNVVLLSLYELGHQPFGIASPAAWLAQAGASVTCLDLAVEHLNEQSICDANLIAIYIPMHTATRLAVPITQRIKALNPSAHLCFFGLYASVNESFLRSLGAASILGGEFEEGLVTLYTKLAMTPAETMAHTQAEASLSLAKQRFLTPDRSGLPPLDKYAYLQTATGERHIAGYTEASRGCKHLCRHCPIVPVYGGQFRIVQRDIVMADIRQQVAAGAQHITFGDPDFFNGPGHAVAIVKALYAEFANLTYDVIIKVEHLLRHMQYLPTLGETGCLFITTAVEAVDNDILQILDKGHTRADFAQAVALCRDSGLTLTPTFVAFNPWITLEGYLDLLRTIADLDLVDHVAPIQYAIRLLIPAGSRLLELGEVKELIRAFDKEALVYPWQHADPRVDRLQEDVLQLVQKSEASDEPRHKIFTRIWKLTRDAIHDGQVATKITNDFILPSMMHPHGRAVPRLSEPWYC